jgi:putative nucleotidyltransferase with HDIG domain
MATDDPATSITLEWLVSETTTVYSLPLFYEKLNKAINHPRSSLADIAMIITDDHGLTVRVLKLANSPMFGFFSKIDSITKAISIIGTQQVRDLALAASVMDVFKGIPDELMNMRSFWQHCISCGIIARNLATYRREINLERFFVAGMLHDVGELAMCTVIPDVVREMFEESRAGCALNFTAENERLGFNHAKVGGKLLGKWGLPESIVEPVSNHHSPGNARHFPLETALVHIADIICRALEIGCGSERFVPPLDDVAWKRFGGPVTSLATIIKQSESQLNEAFAILAEGCL